MTSIRIAIGLVLAAATLTIMQLSGVAFAEEATAKIDGVEVSDGHARFVLTTANLRAEDVRVTVDGQPLTARLTPVDTQEASAPSRAVVIVFDTSGSMADAGRITAARQAAQGYAKSLPPDVLVGLVAFSDKPSLVVAPTKDRPQLLAALDTLQANGNTALYDAISFAVSALAGVNERRIVVLSDGADTSSKTSSAQAAAQLSAERIPADVVTYQYNGGAAPQQLAAAAGGRVLSADDTSQLSAAFAAVAQNFTQRTQVELDVPSSLAGRKVQLEVAVGSSAKTSAEVTFAALPSLTAPTPPSTPERPLNWQLWALVGGVFAVLLVGGALVIGLVGRGDRGREVESQVARYGPRRTQHTEQPQERAAARTAIGLAQQVLTSFGREQALATRLDLAAMKIRPAEWTVACVVVVVVLAASLTFVTGKAIAGIGIGVVLGWVIMRSIVSVRISTRRKAFGDQLPDTLQLVAGSLRSGFSLAQALDTVVREDQQPTAGEFSHALAETRIGATLEDALNRVAERMRSSDLEWVVMAIRIQRTVGGNLAEVLLTTVATMRERAQTRRQVQALSAEGRLSAYVLVALPIVLCGVMALLRPEYMALLFTTTTGLLMAAGAVGLIAVGAVWMRTLVNVEV